MSGEKSKTQFNLQTVITIAGIIIPLILTGISAYTTLLNKYTYLTAVTMAQEEKIDRTEIQINSRLDRIENKLDSLFKVQGYKIPITE